MSERDRTHSFGMQCEDHRWVTVAHVCACGVSHGTTLIECGEWCEKVRTEGDEFTAETRDV